MPIKNRISLLDNRLANQIAAGEVVERPASVVKELIENSIDAGATRIEVDIERGGTRLIRVTDNGKGIHKDDLALALTRHATSKISVSEDLSNIQSLGFRGEALASISSVSKLILTSRIHDSDIAWQAIAQGRNMQVEIQPAAASPGTRIEIADLFFNTPARQKFLRTEKTEFSHIEDVFKRHALANFNIAFMLKHNHKIVKRVPACGEKEQQKKRLATICGKVFADNAIAFECQHESIQINGWLGGTNFHRSESDIQYVFINQRPVKDKTLNHAIRSAYEGLLPVGRMAAYVIYLQIDPKHIDVNVHPTKHEVRFSEQRLVHDLLAKSVKESLEQQLSIPSENLEFSSFQEKQKQQSHQKKELHRKQTFDEYSAIETIKSNAFTHNSNISSHQSEKVFNPVRETSIDYQKIVNRLDDIKKHNTQTSNIQIDVIQIVDDFYLYKKQNKPILINAKKLLKKHIQNLINEKVISDNKLLLFPAELSLSVNLLEDYQCHQLLIRLGFDFESLKNQEKIIFKAFPLWLASINHEKILSQIPDWLQFFQNNKQEDLIKNILTVFQNINTDLIELLINSETAKQILNLDNHQIENIFCALDKQRLENLFK